MAIGTKITEDKKSEIREYQKIMGIQASARKAGVSYYTAWCVYHGKYELKHLQEKTYSSKLCPITGWSYR